MVRRLSAASSFRGGTSLGGGGGGYSGGGAHDWTYVNGQSRFGGGGGGTFVHTTATDIEIESGVNSNDGWATFTYITE